MTNLKTTKRALLSSVVALLVCFTMLLGTTFAWFTDSVTSNGNIIQTGTLEIGMYWMEGDEDPTTADWADASEGAIFNNTKWEPGYVEAKHIKIANEGTLALKYKLLIVPNGEVEALADVIDVYYVEGATQVTRDTLPETAVLVGTLRDMIEDTDGAVHGALLPVGETATDTYERVGEVTATIAFKMREEAGNEYKGMSIGTDFSIQLLATQYTFEKESFDNQYDKDALYPVATAAELISALSEGKSVALANDISVVNQTVANMSEGTEQIIDLNGNDIIFSNTKPAAEQAIGAANGATLNLVNSGEENSLITLKDGTSIAAMMNGVVNIQGVDLKVVETGGQIYADMGGVINMYGGSLTSELPGDGIRIGEQSTCNMYGGEITATAYPGGSIVSAIGASDSTATINLYGGKMNVSEGAVGIVAMTSATIHIDQSFVLNVTEGGYVVYESKKDENKPLYTGVKPSAIFVDTHR